MYVDENAYSTVSYNNNKKKQKQSKCPSKGDRLSKLWYTYKIEYYAVF